MMSVWRFRHPPTHNHPTHQPTIHLSTHSPSIHTPHSTQPSPTIHPPTHHPHIPLAHSLRLCLEILPSMIDLQDIRCRIVHHIAVVWASFATRSFFRFICLSRRWLAAVPGYIGPLIIRRLLMRIPIHSTTPRPSAATSSPSPSSVLPYWRWLVGISGVCICGNYLSEARPLALTPLS